MRGVLAAPPHIRPPAAPLSKLSAVVPAGRLGRGWGCARPLVLFRPTELASAAVGSHFPAFLIASIIVLKRWFWACARFTWCVLHCCLLFVWGALAWWRSPVVLFRYRSVFFCSMVFCSAFFGLTLGCVFSGWSCFPFFVVDYLFRFSWVAACLIFLGGHLCGSCPFLIGGSVCF